MVKRPIEEIKVEEKEEIIYLEGAVMERQGSEYTRRRENNGGVN